MGNYSQDNLPMGVTTPLGKDVLLLVGFSGHEAISQLFSFHLDLMSEKSDIAFDTLLGQKISFRIDMPDGSKQTFNGLVKSFGQGETDGEFTRYQMELVPQLWLLTKKAQSRIFQQKSVIDILKKVFEGLDASFETQGTYQPRDYCVQYRETDFNFASRLMEEEGIWYMHKHTADGHKLVVGDSPQSHPKVSGSGTVKFEPMLGGMRLEQRVHHWAKVQEIRAGKYVLWDHCFELPHKHLEAEQPIGASVAVGEVTHKLKVGGNDKLELYDWPGEYAQRFDGVDKGGGDNAGDLQKIFDDNKRTVGIRMDQETVAGLLIHGSGACMQFVSGQQFTLQNHVSANGDYVLVSVQHQAMITGGLGAGTDFSYTNTFTCIPLAQPYRPSRLTPKPVVQGPQTAVVVGQPGDEIFTDKYGRIKVKFHWDRDPKKDASSSCWIRVVTPWAGQQWGMVHIPRVGHEVVVAFEEGDPDRPLVVGSVYNAELMPPYKLPDNKTQSGLKSRSSQKGSDQNFNEIFFEDKKGEELLYVRAEKDQKIAVENDEAHWVGNDRVKEVDHDETTTIGNDRTETVKNDEKITIQNNRTENVKQGDEKVTIEMGNRTIEVSQGNDTHDIKMGNREVKIEMGNDDLKISLGNQTTKLDVGASSTEAMQSITLKVGQNSIVVDQMGVTIKGMMISIQGQIQTEVKGLMTSVSGDAMTTIKGAITMIN